MILQYPQPTRYAPLLPTWECPRLISFSLRHINQKNGTKELWGAVRKLTKRCQEDQIASGIDATILNNHYAKISTDTLYTAPPTKTSVTSQEEHFTEYEVFKHLDSLRATATGLDQLPAWFLRLGAPVFAKHLNRLFNRSVSDSIVPEQWKQAYIRPIQKTPTPSGPADYRPISITPVLSRLLEKLVVKHYFYPAIQLGNVRD